MTALSPRIFKWAQRSEWSKVMFSLLADELDNAVLAEVQRRNPQYLLENKFGWLDDAVASVKGRRQHIHSLLASRIGAYYDDVVAFHGCRPVSLETYRLEGLKPSNTEAIRRQARLLFGDSEALARAIADLGGAYESHNHGNIWLCITKESFLKQHDSFLLRGCEYLSGLANRVEKGDLLSRRGIPTIVECLIPASQISERFWDGLSHHFIEDWFSRFLRPREIRPICTFCLTVSTTIPPERIKFHQFMEKRHRYSWEDFNTGERQTGEYIKFSPLRIGQTSLAAGTA
jgi:hypothetical protein